MDIGKEIESMVAIKSEQNIQNNLKYKDKYEYLVSGIEDLVTLKKQILTLVDYGCKYIVLDPIQDVLDGSTNEEQVLFMRWQKGMVKKGITFININYIRKATTGQKAGSQMEENGLTINAIEAEGYLGCAINIKAWVG